MHSSIEIDEGLLHKALKASGLGSMRAVIEEGLRLLIKVRGQKNVRRLRGKIVFDGDALNEKGMK